MTKSLEQVTVFTDGGARGNPGPAGLGVVVYEGSVDPGRSNGGAHIAHETRILKEHYRYLGKATNNQAEYAAVIDALEIANKLGARQVKVYADSKLIVEQLNGNYKVKDKMLAQLFVKVWNIKHRFESVTFFHVPREQNKVADKLANKAMDKGAKKSGQ